MTTEQKILKVYSPILQKDVNCVLINNIKYAQWETMDDWMPPEFLTGAIEFEPIVKDKINEIRFVNFADVEAGIIFAVRQPTMNPKEELSFRRYAIRGPEKFDLNNRAKRIEAFILAHQDFVEGSIFNDSGAKTYVRMFNIQQRALKNRREREKFTMCREIIDELAGDDLKNFARVLIPIDNVHDDIVIQDQLEDYALKNPQHFLNEWRNADRTLRELFLRAKDFGTIVYRQDLGFTYRDNPIGYSELEVLNTFRKNPQITSSINSATLESERLAAKTGGKDYGKAMDHIREIAKVPPGDRSMTDNMISDAISQQTGGNVQEMLKEIRASLKEEILAEMKIDQKEKISKEAEDDDLLFNEEENIQKVNQAIEEKRHKLEQGLLAGKDISDWKYSELKKYTADNLDRAEYGDKINAKKEELFDFLIKWNLEQLDMGIIIPENDSTGNG
jgi:hypothetical protein